MKSPSPCEARKSVLLFTKPPVAGRVKTRLIGALTPEQAAELHAAFLGDLVGRLSGQPFALVPIWALEAGEAVPPVPPGGSRQAEGDLGVRMRHAFAELFSRSATPAATSTTATEATGALAASPATPALAVAIGSDLPQLEVGRIEAAFQALAAGADVVLGPARDGGYYLIGLCAAALRATLFEGIAWSTGEVLDQTLERCRAAGLAVTLLAEEEDIDTAEALARLARRLESGKLAVCPCTSALLAEWRRRDAVGDGRKSEERCVS